MAEVWLDIQMRGFLVHVGAPRHVGNKVTGESRRGGQRERAPGGVGRGDWEDVAVMWEECHGHVSIKKLLCCPAVSGGLCSCVMC